MLDTHNLAVVILDADWHPVERLVGPADWRLLMQTLLGRDSRWLVLDQDRSDRPSPLPDATDIVLTRSLARRLRPMDMTLADHVIRAADGDFSFRAAGLL
ncbi:JAB domain-containing protein [Sphingobium sp. AN558]|uniref:JAB domain-containing protein n=1 Tax=Sphingobium sp. AN558 TaxID=3133442 RepID=UPI0030C2359A